MVHDLCAQHADGVRVPMGWELRDERRQAAPLQHAQLDLIGA
jgi:hypothetical protein